MQCSPSGRCTEIYLLFLSLYFLAQRLFLFLSVCVCALMTTAKGSVPLGFLTNLTTRRVEARKAGCFISGLICPLSSLFPFSVVGAT